MTPLMRKLLFVLSFVVLFAAVAQAKPAADKWPLKIPDSTWVILKVPEKAIVFEKTTFFITTNSYTVSVDQGPTGLTVGGYPDWQTKGWAAQYYMKLTKAEKKTGYFQVELEHANGNHVKLRFLPSVTDINAALDRLVFPGTLEQFKASDYYQKELTGLFLPKIFTGPLAGIAADKQLKLLEAVQYGLEAIGGETYKGKFYLKVRLPDAPDDAWNSNRVNRPSRVSRTLQAGALTLLKGLNEVIAAGVPEIQGIKLEINIFYRDPNATNENSIELMALYATAEQLIKFAENDITNQQLVDNSIILVDGDRMAVSLTNYD
jgi:hypothetical protein